MSLVSAKDYRSLLEIIDIVYSVQDRATMMHAMWEKLEKLIGISSAIWLPMDSQTRQFQFKDHLRYRAPIKPAFLFTVYYAPLNPLTESGFFSKDMAVFKMTDALSACKLKDTEYGFDFLPLTPHFYELVATPCSQGELLGGIGLHRQRHDGDFTERHREMFKVLLPHLSRALHDQYLREALMTAHDSGVIVIAADGHPLLMNDEARRALHGRPVATIPDPRMGAKQVVYETEAGTYRVRTVPVRRGGKEKIIVLEPQLTEREIVPKLAEYGLTKREQEIAVLAIRGLSNREIAEQLFIADQTVKDHLHDVFEKMKIRRRSELAARCWSLARDDVQRSL